LNVGHALPSVAQALVFIAIVEVETRTLVLMIGASVAGAWLGASLVAGWTRRRVQVGMGLALLTAATLLARQLLRGAPIGADALALDGSRLALGVAGNFILGAMMTIGVGLYAPCMILVSLLGMNAKAAFPIMMGSCAFLMPVAGVRFIARDAYAPRVALGLTLGGIPAVLVAAFVVRSLPLGAVRVLVLVVAVYTALSMLLAARKSGAMEEDRRHGVVS
ncbi:MAG: permease, partial [Candidatus Binatia bacterium]